MHGIVSIHIRMHTSFDHSSISLSVAGTRSKKKTDVNPSSLLPVQFIGLLCLLLKFMIVGNVFRHATTRPCMQLQPIVRFCNSLGMAVS
mmetsp:Transcript_13915/g.39602  ORF Transcript_13915/g.39602 Transcript_13915/m.39602 type:complete len:89 (-) Transcript_13915:360-626(-)